MTNRVAEHLYKIKKTKLTKTIEFSEDFANLHDMATFIFGAATALSLPKDFSLLDWLIMTAIVLLLPAAIVLPPAKFFNCLLQVALTQELEISKEGSKSSSSLEKMCTISSRFKTH